MSGLVKTHYLNKNSKKTVKNCDVARVPIGTQSDIYIFFFLHERLFLPIKTVHIKLGYGTHIIHLQYQDKH